MPGHRPRSTRPAAALVAASLVAGALGVALPTSIRAHGSQAMAMAGQTPKVGEMAHDFTLTSIAGDTVSLKDHLGTGPVVLLMMRGWPGYQCPFCTRQFGDYLRNADALAAAGARVIFVYPGPAEGLEAHAKMFAADREMPPHFSFLIDPDYTFTNRYGLRWNAPQETSYPTTFVLDRTGTVRFVNVSREHGGRVPVAEVLKAIGMMGGSWWPRQAPVGIRPIAHRPIANRPIANRQSPITQSPIELLPPQGPHRIDARGAA